MRGYDAALLEYNSVRPLLPSGEFRHPDRRFEWTRREFAAWCEGVAARHGYAVSLSGVGDPHPASERGAPTQMAVLDREMP